LIIEFCNLHNASKEVLKSCFKILLHEQHLISQAVMYHNTWPAHKKQATQVDDAAQ